MSVEETWKQRPSQIRFSIQRTVLDFQDLAVAADYKIPPSKHFREYIEIIKKLSCKKCVFNTIPILKWLPKYQWKTDLLCDLTAGFTIAIMHIPQGMAYAILAKVDPIVGVYMGLFPVFVYALFGTSRHISIGTVAVMSLMCAQTVETYFDEQNGRDDEKFTAMDVVTALCLDVGLIHVLMYTLRLGIITTLLSESLVNAYTCASAVWILASQMPSFFDVKLPKRNGFGKMIIVFYDSAVAFPNSNWVTFSMSVIFFVILVIYLEVLKPRLARKTKIPFPIELVCVISGTIISYSCNFHELYDVSVIGHVPAGWPRYKFPPMELLPRLILDALAVAIVAYGVTISMSFIIASKRRYEIKPNQELLAMGIGNLVGCGFHCMPSGGSIPRTAVQEAVGGATQMTSLICCVLLLNVIMYMGNLVNRLPMCVLACIITVHLKSVLLQIVSLKKYWLICKWDFLIWIATFITTVVIDLTVGLVCGVCVSLLTVFLRTQLPYTSIMASLPQTGLYLNVERYSKVSETGGVKIFSFSGALSFLTKDVFKSSLIKKIGINPVHVMEQISQSVEVLEIRCVILDLSGVAYADPSGATILIELVSNFRRIGIFLFISGCAENVIEQLQRCKIYDARVNNLMVFPTVYDAVLFAESNVLEN